MRELGVLILDDDVDSQQALRHVLDSEGWRVRIVTGANDALMELTTGDWALVIANVALMNVNGPAFGTLRELCQASFLPGAEAENDARSKHKQVRILFLVPPTTPKSTLSALESEGLPYSLKPYHLHEFLEKVSDLLLETGAIAAPIRSVNARFSSVDRSSKLRHHNAGRPRSRMFASRDDYQMTEEEIAEYERQEQEQQKKKGNDSHGQDFL